MPKAVIYTRVSTNLQEKDGTSLDSQIDSCRIYAEQKEFEISREYREVFSGADILSRKLLNDLRSDVKRRAFDCVVIYAVDRLSRNLAHLSILLDEFEQYGVALHIVTEEFENTAIGKFLISARGFAAELEREKIRERCMRGRRTNAVNGTSSYRRPLFGYHVTERGRSISDGDGSSECVREMFNAVLAGNSLRSIAEHLSSRGVLTPSGSRTWWAHSVGSIIKNPAYCGRTTVFRTRHDIRYINGVRKNNGSAKQDVQNHIVLPDVTPAIVSPEVFDAVQLKLQDNKKAKRGGYKIEALLRGRVRCATCGRFYTPVMSNTYRSYVCTSKQNPSLNCGTKMLGADFAETEMWAVVTRIIRHPEEMEQFRLSRQQQAETRPDEVEAINKSIRKQELDIERMVVRSADVDDKTWAVFQKKIDSARSEIDRLNISRQQLLRTPIEPHVSFETFRRHAIKRLEGDLDFSEKLEMVSFVKLSAVWDGETLKADFYAQYGCKSTTEGLYKVTVAGR